MAATIPPDAAFAECEHLATTHYENFSVLSWFLPRSLRPHFSSVYAFCRQTDDLGDEGAFTPEQRLARLDAWEHDLLRCFAAGQTPPLPAGTPALQTPEHPYLVALQETIQRFDLPPEPFLALIKANRMDQLVHRYPTYDDLLEYCELSANPVGHLVLMLYGYRDAERKRCSDAICTALQLTNFWQDIARDYQERGRIYLPQQDMARFGYSKAALALGRCTPAFQELLAFEVERTRDLFAQGMPLLAHLPGLPRRAVALFVLGGLKTLAAIERQGCDVFSRRPTLSRRQKLWLMTRVALHAPGHS